MRIVFGWNHFRIKSFDPFELGLTRNPKTDFKIELRQNYFHLFWIPFFGLGKKWAIRKNNQLYELPAVYTNAIRGRSDLHVKSPWYTYSGPLLIMAGLAIFALHEKYDHYINNKMARERYAAETVDNFNRFRAPSLDDYYILRSGYTTRYAKVSGLSKKGIELTYIADRQAWVSDNSKMVALFTDPQYPQASVALTWSDSTRFICSDYDKADAFQGIDLKEKEGKGNTYRLEKVLRLDGPMFRIYGSSSAGNGSSYTVTLQLKNEGFASTVTKLETLAGDMKWHTNTDSLPLVVPAQKTLYLRGEGQSDKYFKLQLSCLNIYRKPVGYILEGPWSDLQVTRLE